MYIPKTINIVNKINNAANTSYEFRLSEFLLTIMNKTSAVVKKVTHIIKIFVIN